MNPAIEELEEKLRQEMRELEALDKSSATYFLQAYRLRAKLWELRQAKQESTDGV